MVFPFNVRCIDNTLSMSYLKFCYYVVHIYSVELEINDTTDTARYVSYMDNEDLLRTKGWFIFPNCELVALQQHLYVGYISLSEIEFDIYRRGILGP